MAEKVDCPHCGKQHVTVPDADGHYVVKCPNKEYVFFPPQVVVDVSHDSKGKKDVKVSTPP